MASARVLAVLWEGFWVRVNLWHSPGTSPCSVSQQGVVLSRLILYPRAAQLQLADGCPAYTHSTAPRHRASWGLHQILVITCDNSPNRTLAWVGV